MARGHLRQRVPGGPWYGVVDRGPHPVTGKRRQAWVKLARTKREAETALARLVLAADQDALGDAGVLTVAAYLDRYLAAKAPPALTPKTHANYRLLVQHQIVPVLGQVQLTKLKTAHCMRLAEALKAMTRKGSVVPLSPARQHQAFVVFKAALTQAVKWKLIPSNPALTVDAPTAPPVEMHPWTAAQATAFLDAVVAEGVAWRAFFGVALNTGMRLAELVGLRWIDVKLDEARVEVHQTIAFVQVVDPMGRKEWAWVVKAPKTRAGRRALPIGPELVALLRRHRAAQAAERVRLGPHWSDWGLVFPSLVGTPVQVGRVRRVMARACAVAGVPVIRFHDLRHTAATLMLADGANVKVVSERLGHASVTITMSVYAHALPGMQEAAALRLEDRLRGVR